MKDIPIIVRTLGTICTDGVGFGSVPDQIRERSIAQGFELNMAVVGRRGLGASTLVNSLFGVPLVDKKRLNAVSVTRNEVVEGDVCLEISVATYHEPGVDALVEHIDRANREYFDNELGLFRLFKDNRVHVCMYLLPSDVLTDAEIQDMHVLSHRCNLVPVIPKADMYTPEELAERKSVVRQILADNNVQTFTPHMARGDGDLDAEAADIANSMPLAVTASEIVYDHDGEIVRGRKYPWGFVNIESEEGNDFKRLQRLLVHTSLDDLIAKTNDVFYNSFRAEAWDYENGCGALREARYHRLRAETLRILSDKQEAKIEMLRREEADLDRFYMGRIGESEVEEQVGRTLQMQ